MHEKFSAPPCTVIAAGPNVSSALFAHLLRVLCRVWDGRSAAY